MGEINDSIDWVAAGLLFVRFGLALVMLISAAFVAGSLAGGELSAGGFRVEPTRRQLVQASVASFVFAGAAAVLVGGLPWSGDLW